ncbi:hypothetical protein D3C87_1328260 [compost metagenome]
MRRQATAQRIVGIEAADHIAATVEIQHHRLQAIDRLPIAIQPRRQAVTVPRGNGEILASNVVQWHIEKRRGRFEVDPRLLRSLLVHRATFARQAAELGEFEESFKFWQHGHGTNPFTQ